MLTRTRLTITFIRKMPGLSFHAIKRRTYENFAELRYNITASAVIFQCTLILLPP